MLLHWIISLSLFPTFCLGYSFMIPVPVIQLLNADTVLYTVLSFTARRASTLQQRLEKCYIEKIF